MKIKIVKLPTEESITVQKGYFEGKEFVLEECNHGGAEYHLVDFGAPDYYKGDYVDNWRLVQVCDKCKAVKNGDGWCD